jgi:U3 small nucleolar ribonucleoprotein protein IMP4
MKVTTSRDPSAKTRRLGKALAAFLCIPYVNRGKQSLEKDDVWLIMAEEHGNPRGIIKRHGDSEEHLAFKIVIEPVSMHLRRTVPIVSGEKDDAFPIASFFELNWSDEHLAKRAIIVASGQMDFVDNGETQFRIKT